jgi:hypothetical protein
MKKNILIILSLLLCSLVIYAQSPQAVNYQGVARDNSGNILANQTVSLKLNILSGSASGPVIYAETHLKSTDEFGLFSLKIGQGTIVSGAFNAINWGSNSYYLKVEIDPAGGTNYQMVGTSEFVSVPYALYAERSGSTMGSVVYSGNWDAISNSPVLTSSAGSKGFYYVVTNASVNPNDNTTLDGINDWASGDWVVYNGAKWEKVDNSESPVNASDVHFAPGGDITAINVEDAINELGLDGELKLTTKADKVTGATNGNFAGLTLSGNLTDSGKKPSDYLDKDNTSAYTPASDYNPATKKYVDDQTSLISGNRVPDGTSFGQTLHWGGTSWATDSSVFSNGKRFGIGISLPDSPLGIRGEAGQHDEMISFTSNDNSRKWNINLNPSGDNVGFSIDDLSVGLHSRFFIAESSGHIGIGTTSPEEKLDINDSLAGGTTGIKIKNDATQHSGFVIGQTDDNIVSQRRGSFGIFEKTGSGKTERITILPGIQTPEGSFYNVGINETMPYATLHVNRPVDDPKSDIKLSENTGILLLGDITGKNLGLDSHQIQARQGEYAGGGTTIGLTAASLSLQPLGGGILINSSLADDKKVLITEDGKIGIGKTPIESLDVNGAMTIGDATGTSPADGTIRFNGSDFEGRKSGVWKSFTSPSVNDGFGNAGVGKITYNPTRAMVGIGVDVPVARLHVRDSSVVTEGNTSVLIENQSSTGSVNAEDNRIGLQVSNFGSWSSNASAKNIGLYVSSVSGQANKSANLGAVINGNVVIGNILPTSEMVGANGSNVLVIQNGTAPSTPLLSGSGMPDGGVQIYSGTDATGASVLMLMNGNGEIVKLYRESALTPADNTTVGSTYGTNEANVINNLRTRIDELEARLKALGLLH